MKLQEKRQFADGIDTAGAQASGSRSLKSAARRRAADAVEEGRIPASMPIPQRILLLLLLLLFLLFVILIFILLLLIMARPRAGRDGHATSAETHEDSPSLLGESSCVSWSLPGYRPPATKRPPVKRGS